MTSFCCSATSVSDSGIRCSGPRTWRGAQSVDLAAPRARLRVARERPSVEGEQLSSRRGSPWMTRTAVNGGGRPARGTLSSRGRAVRCISESSSEFNRYPSKSGREPLHRGDRYIFCVTPLFNIPWDICHRQRGSPNVPPAGTFHLTCSQAFSRYREGLAHRRW